MATYDFGARRHLSVKDSTLKVRMSIAAPPGGGKTFTLLTTAFALLKDLPRPRILVGDTENRSASKYADLFPPFDVVELDQDHSPQCMKALIDYAEKENYDALIIDSVSHEWNGKNGVLEQVDNITAKTGKSTEAWRQVTPHHDAFFQRIMDCRLHFFGAFRSKMQVAVEKDERGKAVVRRLGMQPITREGADYEFDVTARMEPEGNVLIIEKTRCPKLNGKVFRAPSHEVADALREWLGLSGGSAKAPSAPVTPVAPPPVEIVAAPDEAIAPEAAPSSGTKPVAERPEDKPVDEHAVLLAQFRKLVGADEDIYNNMLVNANVPYISLGQTWRDLSIESLKKLLGRTRDLTRRAAEAKNKVAARQS